MKKVIAVAAVTVLGSFVFRLQAAPAEIYLVRHAEKVKSANKDPELSACGLAQAQAMAVLIPATLTSIYHSGYQRTQQTAEQIRLNQPTASVKAYDARDLAALAKAIQQQNSPVLVVGHSNTTPELIYLLSQLTPPQIGEQDYGVVYQLKQSEQGYQLLSFAISQPAICQAKTI
jgi:phosphohistidine phosphatase SixA